MPVGYDTPVKTAWHINSYYPEYMLFVHAVGNQSEDDMDHGLLSHKVYLAEPL